MKKVTHTDEQGRKYQYLLPDWAEDTDLDSGIMNGPQDVVDLLDLPEHVATALHNELFKRGIMDYDTAKKKPREIQGAIISVLKLDVAIILDAFYNIDRETVKL